MPKRRVTLPLEIVYPDIGPVSFVASQRARRINIRIRADGSIRVAVPRNASLRQAEKFVVEKRDWIARQLRMGEERRRATAELVSRNQGFDSDRETERIRQRLAELAEEHGFSCNRVTIRNQKTRWGSCSANNNISLNLKLALLPARLMDLVLLHELVHTEIKNHGPEFYRRLTGIMPDCRGLDRELKSYSPLLLTSLPQTPPVNPDEGGKTIRPRHDQSES